MKGICLVWCTFSVKNGSFEVVSRRVFSQFFTNSSCRDLNHFPIVMRCSTFWETAFIPMIDYIACSWIFAITSRKQRLEFRHFVDNGSHECGAAFTKDRRFVRFSSPGIHFRPPITLSVPTSVSGSQSFICIFALNSVFSLCLISMFVCFWILWIQNCHCLQILVFLWSSNARYPQFWIETARCSDGNNMDLTKSARIFTVSDELIKNYSPVLRRNSDSYLRRIWWVSNREIVLNTRSGSKDAIYEHRFKTLDERNRMIRYSFDKIKIFRTTKIFIRKCYSFQATHQKQCRMNKELIV